MNQNKKLKPNLLDPLLEKKIIKTLTPVQDDYWGPTKNFLKNVFEKYIKPNIFLIIIIIIIVILLIYRYRITKKDRQKKETMNHESRENIVHDNKDELIKKQINDYANLVLAAYNRQKEDEREPIVNHRFISKKSDSTMNFAYPMFPYAKGGTLMSPGSLRNRGQ